MHRHKLDPTAVASALQALNARAQSPWVVKHDALHKTFRFRGFSQAFGFMTRVALAAEVMDHHPDWCNAYKTVRVELSTHDVGGLTELDFALAERMEDIAGDA